jgi:hypothetical protein
MTCFSPACQLASRQLTARITHDPQTQRLAVAAAPPTAVFLLLLAPTFALLASTGGAASRRNWADPARRRRRSISQQFNEPPWRRATCPWAPSSSRSTARSRTSSAPYSEPDLSTFSFFLAGMLLFLQKKNWSQFQPLVVLANVNCWTAGIRFGQLALKLCLVASLLVDW